MLSMGRRVRTIFLKDFRDALRDARVLFAILTPLGIGILYNFIIDDDVVVPSVTVAIAGDRQSELPLMLADGAGDALDFDVWFGEEREVRQAVDDGDADIGILLSENFDEDLMADDRPSLEIVLPPVQSIGAEYVLAAIDPAIRTISGQPPLAEMSVVVLDERLGTRSIIDQVGARSYFVLFSQVMMIAMVGMLALPIVLTEETEKGTIEALSLVSSYGEIVSAKALLGMVYVGASSALLVGVTRIVPDDWPVYVLAITALGLTVIGFGLLLAGLLKNANQLNTWSGLVLLPVITPAFLVGLGESSTIGRIAGLTPAGAAMNLLLDSATESRLNENLWQSLVIVMVWGVAAYALLVWQLSRRNA